MGKITELDTDSAEMPPTYAQTEVPKTISSQPSKYADLRKQIESLESDESFRNSVDSEEHVSAEHTTDATSHDEATPSIQPSKQKHHHFGQRLKNKLTGTTHEEREEERARRQALYQRAYEAAPVVPPYGGYGYGYGYGGYGLGYGYGLGNPLLFDAALLGGLGGFGLGALLL
ncbi:uncharacterized protein AB675_11181 [Cyphellophora attinorum]|uniref:Uncharacterized protein n=1 Tax=Cyphellophora attinorum TaxID=1664694 RepID=A0A0N0NIH2_9EURO|nr:uncharacterized protein AB675_11181 [Phialophora attinorum]KPI35831.1 hypothetical protein AB675_11181 [Phialophora attinorum]